MSLETFGVVEVRKGSLCVRPKLGLEKRKGPGEKKRSRLPTSSVLGRAVKRSRKAGVCFLLPFPASQETRAQAVLLLFTPTGSNGSPRRGFKKSFVGDPMQANTKLIVLEIEFSVQF